VRAVMTADGVRQHVRVDVRDGATRFFGVPQADPPWIPDQMAEVANSWVEAWQGKSFHLAFAERFDGHRAALSWARAAFLVAFAQFGYTYGFATALTPLREALLDPATRSLRVPIFDTALDVAVREMAYVTDPDDLRGIAVVFARRVVLLPHGDDKEFFTRWGEVLRTKQFPTGITVQGHNIPWPTYPRHALDHAEVDR